MKILYNIDGSISKLILGKFVQQNNNNVDKISVAINGKLPEQYQVNAVFTLPDGTVNEILASQTETIEFGSFHIDGYYFYLTNAQTLYSGVLKMSLQIIDILDSRKVLWTYQTEFTINPTGVLPSEVNITQAEYNAIVEAIGSSITPEVQWGQILGSLVNQADLAAALNAKQVKLIAGENIMTINGQSILQGGNLDVGILTQAQIDATNSGITQAKREGYDAAVVSLENHESNTVIHVTSGDKNTWNQAVTLLTSHVNNETIHVTGNEKATWNAHVINTGIHVTPTQKTNWDNHIADSNIHVTLTEKTGWDNKSVVVASSTGTSTSYISFITIDGIEYQINPLVSGSVNWGNITGSLSAQTDLQNALDAKQETLVSGTNIKTFQGGSMLGSGDLNPTWGKINGTLSDQTDLQAVLDRKQELLVSGSNIKTINGQSIVGSGNVSVGKTTLYLHEISITTTDSSMDTIWVINSESLPSSTLPVNLVTEAQIWIGSLKAYCPVTRNLTIFPNIVGYTTTTVSGNTVPVLHFLKSNGTMHTVTVTRINSDDVSKY